PNVELTPFFSGIALDVTPQISEDGMVTLHIHPSITDVKDDRKEILIADQQISLPLAISTIRESDSIVQVKSGQMVVIGGLMSEVEQDLDGGVPWLSDIPVIGNAFKHKSTHKVKTELVILLKPVVVEAGQPWQQQIDGLSEAMRKRLGE
ncbi:MAG TPA: pilus (MSHA type) biogenesis protein MshL, partial [Gammaproteobacteria bacterium]|nr:pilus (MSHA type) biogenesis protein MshL [Gammaproteobacteria bacterium]